MASDVDAVLRSLPVRSIRELSAMIEAEPPPQSMVPPAVCRPPSLTSTYRRRPVVGAARLRADSNRR